MSLSGFLLAKTRGSDLNEKKKEMLREATEKGVINVARYHHHQTVCVCGNDDDISGNARKGLDVTKASNAFRNASANWKTEGMMLPPSTSGVSLGGTQRKRPFPRRTQLHPRA